MEKARMPVGPGKYDEYCTKIREETKAEGVLLAVFGGSKGDGFSVQAPFELLLELPEILRNMARQIEESSEQGHA
jgi:hypothetical protein